MKKSTFIGILFLFSYLNANSQWISVLNPTSSSTYGSSIAVDYQENIYSAGYTFKNSTEKDNYYLVKFNQSGDTLWTRSYDRSNGSDQSVKILIDADNNVLLTGTSYSSSNAEDIVTLKFNSSGDLLNTNIIDGTNHLKDKAIDIISDCEGNYYICGMSQLTSQRAFTLVKTNHDLEKKWTRNFTSYYGADPSSISYNEITQQIAITGHFTDWENLYLMGTVVYDTSGTKIWEDEYRSVSNCSAVGFDVSLNNDESVYVCGYEINANTSKWEAILLKYDTNGDTLWTRKHSAGENAYAVYKSIIQDNAGNAYLTGLKEDIIITAKYTKDGNLLWMKELAGKGSFATNDTHETIKLDNNGDILVLARDYNSTGSGTILIKYTPEGALIWTKHFNESATQIDEALSFDIDESNNTYVIANSRNSNYFFDMATVQFTATETQTAISEPLKNSDLLIYPNPSNGFLHLSKEIESKSDIKVYSLDGKIAYQNVLYPNASNINLKHLPNGVYFLELRSGNVNQISKIILQK